MGHIPIVDFSAHEHCLSSDVTSEQLDVLSNAIYNAFKETGFVYLKNAGVNSCLIDTVRDKSRQFFSLQDEVKQPFFRGTTNHGWVPVAYESLDPTKAGDLKESFTVTTTYSMAWPDDRITGFRSDINIFMKECMMLVDRILLMLAHSLNVEKDFFRECHHMSSTENQTALRCLHYPALKEEFVPIPGQLRCGEHSDWGSITLLFQDQVGGLEPCGRIGMLTVWQVMNRCGEWVAATPVQDTILVNIGDMIQRWTDDLLVSTRHRVLIPDGKSMNSQSRYSMAFFATPDNDFPIKCLNHSDRYEPVTVRDYYKYKLTSTANY